MKSYRITAPDLTDEERRQAAQAGGLAGETVDISPLLGKWEPKTRKFEASSQAMVALQRLDHIYSGTDPAVIADRRRRNKAARRSRRINRLAAKR
ncbi:hypothetical protein H7H51_07735 [Mycolicibacterium farcinogenes]|nr:hypothetical protein [Mycolicibacterium farcinogenes]